MAKKTTTQLADTASQVKGRTTAGSNTALIIGQFFLDLIGSIPFDFDGSRAYNPNENIIWQGRIVKCFEATTPGQSPATHPAKWVDAVIDALEKLGDGGQDYPVLASVLKAYVSQRINEVNANGGVTIQAANSEEINDGTLNNKYVSPLGLKAFKDALVAIITNLTGISEEDLQKVLTNGAVANIMAYFNGGLAAVLEETTIDFPPVVIGDDNVFYKKVTTTTRPPLEIVILNQLEEKDEKVGVGTFRLADDSHNDPLQVTEGGTLQLRLEEQQSDDSWEITTIDRTYTIESGTPGATIPEGLLTIPANSISANAQLTVKATITGGSVVEAPVNVININPADSVDIDAPNADWKGLQGIRREILVEPSNPAQFWVRYLIKSGVNIDNEVTYGTEAPYRSTLIPSLASSEGYTREGGISSAEPNKVIKNRFFYEGSSVELFAETITVAATSPLTVVYTA